MSLVKKNLQQHSHRALTSDLDWTGMLMMSQRLLFGIMNDNIRSDTHQGRDGEFLLCYQSASSRHVSLMVAGDKTGVWSTAWKRKDYGLRLRLPRVPIKKP